MTMELTAEVLASSEWEELRRELIEIELEIRNKPKDRDKALERGGGNLGAKKRSMLYAYVRRHPWCSAKDISEELGITLRIVYLTLRMFWGHRALDRRGMRGEHGAILFLWAVPNTPVI